MDTNTNANAKVIIFCNEECKGHTPDEIYCDRKTPDMSYPYKAYYCCDECKGHKKEIGECRRCRTCKKLFVRNSINFVVRNNYRTLDCRLCHYTKLNFIA